MKERLSQNIPDHLRQRNYQTRYGKWHWENLPKDCYMMDLDSMEIRKDRGIVALIEFRETSTMLNEWQCEIIREISEKLKVPAYFVRSSNFKTFLVTSLNFKNEEGLYITKSFSEEEYKKFLKKL